LGDKTKIEWTDASWNPIRGCSRVSEGCRNCYAERIAARFSGPGQAYEGVAEMRRSCGTPGQAVHGAKEVPRWTGKVRFIEEHLEDPLHWKKPRRIFVNSMSDLFHEKILDKWIHLIFGVMAACPQHIFQILTKRPLRMREWAREVENRVPKAGCNPWLVDWPSPTGEPRTGKWPLPNVWLGVSVEDQKTADERIPLLLQTPAAVRWISYEPALGPVDLWKYTYSDVKMKEHSLLDWVVCGGESGPGARPMHPDWARSVRDQCAAAGVPFFFKQWGAWISVGQGFCSGKDFRKTNSKRDGAFHRVGKKAAGRLLDGREWNEYPRGQTCG
jgi:protein gp37